MGMDAVGLYSQFIFGHGGQKRLCLTKVPVTVDKLPVSIGPTAIRWTCGLIVKS